MSTFSTGCDPGAVNTQPGNVQPWWIRYSLVLFEEGRDFDSLAFLRRLQSKFEGTGEVCFKQNLTTASRYTINNRTAPPKCTKVYFVASMRHVSWKYTY